jgi:hypothetical protein
MLKKLRRKREKPRKPLRRQWKRNVRDPKYANKYSRWE